MRFSDLAIFFKKLEETSSRNTMTEILADLFRRAAPEEIGKICYLLLGRAAPLFEPIEFGVADKFIIRALARAYGVGEDHVRKEFKKLGDLGIAAESCYHVLKHSNKGALSVVDVFDRLDALARMGGAGSQEKKIGILADVLQSIDALSARYLVRIPLVKLRLGFSDMTMLDALSWMLAGDKSLRGRLEDAYNVRPDIGYLAETVKAHGFEGLKGVKATVGAPILPALCQRLPTADEMIKKMGKVAVEGKYDGTRVQIHWQKMPNAKCQMPNMKTFSRNLENTTLMFPELQGIG
ncbi:DNA ligase, partial [Candidatus Gottesmanbacteria bacterium]|nr:DNA ligase [Candidatus Gottesmanbacteria bacterium]